MKNSSPLYFLGYRISYIAKQTNLPSVTVWRHATGKRKISAEIALKYAQALNIPKSKIRPDLWPPDPHLASPPSSISEPEKETA